MSDTNDNEVKKVETLTNDRHVGIVRKYVKNRGFGFITRKSDGADLFVHSRSILHTGLQSLEEGMEVEFFVVQSNRGAEAKDIRIVNKLDSMRDTIEQNKIGNTTNDPLLNSSVNECETGIIIKWNKERRYGFVRRKLNANSLFIHVKALNECGLQQLEIGQQIQFRVRKTEKGEEASDVCLIKCD